MRNLIVVLLVFCGLLFGIPNVCFGKKGHPPRELKVGFEFSAFLDPVYGMQQSSNYRLNGQNTNTPSTLGFYVTQPGKHILEHFQDLTDEANAYYFPIIYKTQNFNHKGRWKLILGFTHDKLQTTNPIPVGHTFRLVDGGNEFSSLVSYGWDIAANVADEIHDYNNHLIIKFDLQFGGFIGNNNCDVDLVLRNGDSLKSVDNKRVFGYGHGLIANCNGEFGYRFWKNFCITGGYRIGGEFINNKAMVSVNRGTEKLPLTVNTIGAFATPYLKFCYEFKCPKVNVKL